MKMAFYGIFLFFLVPTSNQTLHCQIKLKKTDTSYFGPIMVRDVSTKIGPVRDVLRALCAGWVLRTLKHNIRTTTPTRNKTDFTPQYFIHLGMSDSPVKTIEKYRSIDL